MGKGGKKYSEKEATGRIPLVAKRAALEAVDLVIALERYPINSREVEHRVWALTGEIGYLSRLIHVVWRHEGLRRLKEQGAT